MMFYSCKVMFTYIVDIIFFPVAWFLTISTNVHKNAAFVDWWLCVLAAPWINCLSGMSIYTEKPTFIVVRLIIKFYICISLVICHLNKGTIKNARETLCCDIFIISHPIQNMRYGLCLDLFFLNCLFTYQSVVIYFFYIFLKWFYLEVSSLVSLTSPEVTFARLLKNIAR